MGVAVQGEDAVALAVVLLVLSGGNDPVLEINKAKLAPVFEFR